jgi:hypothetical protein
VPLGGDHDQGAAVELAGGLGAVDEFPQPRDRGLWVAVLAVVDEADAAGGDPRDPFLGLGRRGARWSA